MNRLPLQLLGIAVAAFFGALTVGNAVLVAAAALAAVAFGGWAYRARRDAPEQPWSAVRADPARVVPSVPASTHAVVVALGRVEARELVLSPWFALGLGLCAVMVISFASAYDGETWWQVIDDLPFLAHPLVGMTVLAAHRAATSAERDRPPRCSRSARPPQHDPGAASSPPWSR